VYVCAKQKKRGIYPTITEPTYSSCPHPSTAISTKRDYNE
jgi:hypothetical protein